MSETISETMTGALGAVCAWLRANYTGRTLARLRRAALSLAGAEEDAPIPEEGAWTYEDLQELLSTLNEKESGRKHRGVYYTPGDVVRFILDGSARAACGVLTPGTLHVPGLDRMPWRAFCLKKRVLDPTCGAGEFLLAALEAKFALLACHRPAATAAMVRRTLSTVYGNDINRESIAIARLRLFLCGLVRWGPDRWAGAEEILRNNFTSLDFVSAQPDLGIDFDLIVGNPPYVEDSRCGLSLDRRYGNIYANVLRNAAGLLAPGGAMGFIVPLSYVSTPRMRTIRAELLQLTPEQYILSYADRPDCLFTGVHQKLCILIARRSGGRRQVFTGNYQYWYREERADLFARTAVVENRWVRETYIPKLGTGADAAVYEKVRREQGRRLLDLSAPGGEAVYLNMRAAFWIKAFRRPHAGGEYRAFPFASAEAADYAFCLLNSSLFWWYWICVSDCWHITKKELGDFWAPEGGAGDTASRLARALEDRLEETKRYIGTRQTAYAYKHRDCVAEIHAIDDYVDGLFGLTEEESRYIRAFAYRYRVSGGTE